jgi:uncharacterized membrane protein YdjX (TVP38/TMEM64 family)
MYALVPSRTFGGALEDLDHPMTRKWPLTLGLAAFALAMVIFSFSPGGRQAMLGAVDWLRARGHVGIGLFVLAYVVSVLVFVPAISSAAFAGYLYGAQLGLAVALPSALAGATLAFVIGRWLARDTVAAFAARRPRLLAVDAALATGGARIVVLLRLCLPHNLLNYGLAASRVSLRAFVLGTAVGALPLVVMACLAGSLAANAAEVVRMQERLGAWPLVLSVVGLAAALATFAWIVRAARRELARAVAQAGVE